MRAVLKVAFAILLLLLGTAVGIVEGLYILDPVGMKMFDDGDPRGDPQTPWTVHAMNGGIITASLGGAVVLLRSAIGRKRS